jgi:rhodanese-related sulfurtransferase
MAQKIIHGYKELMAKAEGAVLAPEKTIVIHCASGLRSLLATQALQAMGLKPVKNPTGGFAAWKQAGGAVEKVPEKRSR